MAKKGRPTVLTPELQEKIVELLLAGNYRTVACEAAGVPIRTVTDWMHRGRREPEDSIYARFAKAITEAEKRAEIDAVRRVLMDPDVNHLKWWLERKFPERWGRETGLIRGLQKQVKELSERVERQAQGGVTPPPEGSPGVETPAEP